ncbi:MAG: hypothetical protein J7L75_06965 [Thermoproteales archaeon]|nr:hypothetical protein [Thermoproteales archaeon]
MAPQAPKLRVAELKRDEAGKGLVRIDEEAMRDLGLAADDVVEIVGRRRTVAVVRPGYAEDRGAGIIRMDGWTRKNAGVSVGERVEVRRVEAKRAVFVKLVSAEVRLTVDENFVAYVKRRLLGRPLVEGDTVPVPVLKHVMPFIVAVTEPRGPVVVSEDTRVVVLGEPGPSIRQLLVSPTSVKLGGKVAVAGLVRPVLPGVRVRLSYRRPSGSRVEREVKADEEGLFTDVVVVDEAGAWIVKAQVPGGGEQSELYALFLVEE